FFWTLLNPLLMMAILSWVFSVLFRSIENYPVYLFAGLVPWSFLSGSVNECALCIIANEGLIRRIFRRRRNGDFDSIRPTTSSNCSTTSFTSANGRSSAHGFSPL